MAASTQGPMRTHETSMANKTKHKYGQRRGKRMAFYTMMDAASLEELPDGTGKIGLPMLSDGEGKEVMPVFTSEERFWAYVDEKGVEDGIRLFPMPWDVFELARWLKPLGESGQIERLVLDPFVVGEDWGSPGSVGSVKEVCLFLEKFHPKAQRLTREGLARFGNAPEAAEKIMEWAKPSIREQAGNLRAVVREHLVEG